MTEPKMTEAQRLGNETLGMQANGLADYAIYSANRLEELGIKLPEGAKPGSPEHNLYLARINYAAATGLLELPNYHDAKYDEKTNNWNVTRRPGDPNSPPPPLNPTTSAHSMQSALDKLKDSGYPISQLAPPNQPQSTAQIMSNIKEIDKANKFGGTDQDGIDIAGQAERMLDREPTQKRGLEPETRVPQLAPTATPA